MTENAIAKEIVDDAFRIHTNLGPGFLESAYHAVLAYEQAQRGLRTVLADIEAISTNRNAGC
jgi:GxxExxY protein